MRPQIAEYIDAEIERLIKIPAKYINKDEISSKEDENFKIQFLTVKRFIASEIRDIENRPFVNKIQM